MIKKFWIIFYTCTYLGTAIFQNDSFFYSNEILCLHAMKNCSESKDILTLYPTDQPVLLTPWHSTTFSNFLKIELTSQNPLNSYRNPIEINEDFIQTLSLLYNHPYQTHALLPLLKHPDSPQWMEMIEEYKHCFAPMIYTCRKDHCNKFLFNEFNYVPNIFVENVVGLEFSHIINDDSEISSLNMTIIILIENKETQTSKVLRFEYSDLQTFDAILSLLRYFHKTTKIELPVLTELERYNAKLPYRSKNPILLVRPEY